MTHPMLEKVARDIAAANRLLWEALEPASQQSYLRAARAAVQALLEPDASMLDKGMTAAEDALDTDWDSGGGESYDSYTSLRSDAPLAILRAMLLPLVEGDAG